jgi:TP901 family phage tail tape measure protein
MKGLEYHLSTEKAVKAAEQFRRAVTNAADAVDRTGRSVDGLDDAFGRVGQRSGAAAQPVTRVGQEVRRASDAMRSGASSAAAYEQRLDRLQKTSGIAGVSIGRLLGIIGGVAVIRGATRSIADYEDRLAVLGTIAGATGNDLARLEDSARRVSRETRLFKTSEAVQGLTELARAGLDAESATAALKPTADLATVGLLSLDKSAGIVTKTLAQFGFEATEAGRVADVLAKGANSTNTDVAGLSFALSKAGVSAKQFGVDLETTVAALGELANKGVQADRAGTGLARIMIRLANPTDRAKEALRELGLSVDDVNPSARGLIGVLQNLNGANLTLGQSTRLVDTEFADLLTQLSNGVPSIERLNKALDDAGGTSAEQAAARFDTLGGAFSNLGGAAEEFAVAIGEGGLGSALKDVTNLTAEALRVLTGDSDAYLEASEGAKSLATSLRLVAVAGAGLTSLKIGSFLQGFANSANRAITVTRTLQAATGTLAATSNIATRATRSFSLALSTNPIGLFVTVLGTVAAGYALFSNSTDEATAKLEAQRERIEKLERKYRTLGDAIAGVVDKQAAGVVPDQADLQAANDQIEKLAIQFEKAAKASEGLREIEGLEALGKKGFLPDGSDAAGLLDLVRRFREAEEEIEKIGVSIDRSREKIRSLSAGSRLGLGSAKEQERLRSLLKTQADAEEVAQKLTLELDKQGVVVDSLGQVFVESGRGAGVLREALAQVQKIANETGAAVRQAFAGDEGQIGSVVSSLLQDERQRLEIKKLQAEGDEKALLLLRAKLARGQELNAQEKAVVESAAKELANERDILAALKKRLADEKRLKELRDAAPGKLADIEERLRRQLEIARAEGAERTRLIAEQKAAAALPPLSLIDDDDPDRAEALRRRYQEIRDLFLEVEAASSRRKADDKSLKADGRQADLFRQLEQEEAAVRALGVAKQDLLIQQAAENEALQAGIALGSDQYDEYVRRVIAVERLARAQEELGQLGFNAGQAIGSQFERAAFEGGKLRDVLRGIWEDLGRIAFRQGVTNQLANLLGIAGQSLAASFGGGSLQNTPRPTTPNGTELQGPLTPTGAYAPNLAGGLIPAMAGQLIDSPSVLSRGGRNYSVAEGGGVTPEAIFPLQRDARGRLGIVGAGGGGGGPIVMNFPNVRTAQEARAMRATVGQTVRRLMDSDRRGRRGMRPPGA